MINTATILVHSLQEYTISYKKIIIIIIISIRIKWEEIEKFFCLKISFTISPIDGAAKQIKIFYKF